MVVLGGWWLGQGRGLCNKVNEKEKEEEQGEDCEDAHSDKSRCRKLCVCITFVKILRKLNDEINKTPVWIEGAKKVLNRL